MQTTDFDIDKINDEFLNFLYLNLYDEDIKERTLHKTTTITTTANKIYKISSNLAYIHTVVLDDVTLKYGKDYIILYRDVNRGSIELTSIPTEDVDLDVTYGEVFNKGKFIYPDFPRNDLSDESYPRIGFKFTWNREMAGLGDGIKVPLKCSALLQIKIIALTQSEINRLFKILDDLIIDNYKNFYFIRYIDPKSIEDYDNFSDNTEKTFSKVLQYNIPDKYYIR
jgi:hypothetical protein